MNLVDLPPELLLLILTFASSDLDRSRRTCLLLRLSLIHSSFTWPSQSLLHLHLHFPTQVSAARWLSSPSTTTKLRGWDAQPFRSESLVVEGIAGRREGVKGETARKVFERVRGVKRVEVKDFARLSAKVLSAEGLSGLKHLSLLTSFSMPPTPLSLPFTLTSLSLFNSRYPPSLVSLLLHTSSTSLRSLRLSLVPSTPAYTAIITSFPLLAPHLTTLILHHSPSPPLLSLFPLLSSLTTLAMNGSVPALRVIDAVEASWGTLEVLEIQLGWDQPGLVEAVLERVRGGRLVALKEVKVEGGGVVERRVWQELEQLGVRVVGKEGSGLVRWELAHS
ncbi:hypothetical protein MNV49_004502 [Pseudohyphozyma bogoriensis]|nr:hypothetical protein MNV49_004502 [Pseudohyphozyma bogoriensis]